MLIAFENEEQKTGNPILKQMDEVHSVQILNDMIFGECPSWAGKDSNNPEMSPLSNPDEEPVNKMDGRQVLIL